MGVQKLDTGKYRIGGCVYTDRESDKKGFEPLCLICSHNPNSTPPGDCDHVVEKSGLVNDPMKKGFKIVLTCSGSTFKKI